MKTDYKHIYFVDLEQEGKYAVYACYNNSGGDSIGMVKWCPKWRQYCFCTEEQTELSISCLNDIENFIKQLK